MTRHFLSIDNLTPEELGQLLDSSAEIKANPDGYRSVLENKHVALIFEKPSTRTRVSFEVAVTSLGGDALVLRGDELQLGRGEPVEDTGKVLSRYVDAIAVRTFGQERLETLASVASVPVINMLSDYSHPCQCLADLLTVREHKGDLAGRSLAYVGDGNNVAHSLLFGGSKMGMDVRVATPPGYEPLERVVTRSEEIAGETGGRVLVTESVDEAVAGADVIYTDVWASMGQEAEAQERLRLFAPYEVNADVVGKAASDAIVMHCLPAHRGEEISADVIDGPQSVVWDQAENRLHTQKALLVWLLS